MIAVSALCALAALAANNVTIAPDRMATVNGARVFVLGLYENPKDDAVLDEVAKAGINMVHATADVAQLDRLHNHGVYAWINVGTAINLSADTESRKAALKNFADAYAGHAALLAWEVPDEALWNVWYGAQLWRNRDEPNQQDELIAALDDKVKAEKLRGMRAAVRKHWNLAEYKEAESIADSIWRELGKEPPHPDLNISNAPERAAAMATGFLEGYSYLKHLAPNHPIWMNHAPRNSIAQLAEFNKAADVVGCDIYPVPPYLGGHSDLADRGLASVGAYTRRMQDAAPDKPVWMVLQAFSWGELSDWKNSPERDRQRTPSYKESRFMAYDAIVNGARGILYWGSAFTDKTKPFWGEWLALVRELANLQPVLSAPDAELALTVELGPTWGSLDQGIRILPKRTDQGVWLIAVNESQDSFQYTISGLDTQETKYTDTVTGSAATTSNGKLTTTIPPYGVCVLQPEK